MRPIFETWRPQGEVLAGDLTEATSRRDPPMRWTARPAPAYPDPGTSFDNTFPSDGLRTLFRTLNAHVLREMYDVERFGKLRALSRVSTPDAVHPPI